MADKSDVRVNPRNANIGNFHVTFNASADSEFVLLRPYFLVLLFDHFQVAVAAAQIENVYDFRRRAFQGLQNHVFVILRQLKIEDLEQLVPHLVFEWLLAKLTQQRFPKIARHFLTPVALAVAVDPLSEARDVDLAGVPFAVTRRYQPVSSGVSINLKGVLLINIEIQVIAFLFGTQADPANW